MQKNIILILLIILLVIYIFIDNKLFDYYVITLFNEDRLNNIKNQEIKNNIIINKFNAIKGIDIDQQQLINDNLLDKNFYNLSLKRSNEIACYSSHLKLLITIRDKIINKSKYYIILEDDFNICNDNFKAIINDAIKQVKSFDIIFIGWENNDSNSINTHSLNLYKFNPINNFYGTHAYLINPKSIDKIINLIKFIDMPIDEKYKKLNSLNQLEIYWLNPVVINTNYELASTIVF